MFRCYSLIMPVGIDLPELIRLKLTYAGSEGPDDNKVGIDLPELIRLKLRYFRKVKVLSSQSGLICLNWYDWNVSVQIPLQVIWWEVGIDLPELIRLKRVFFFSDRSNFSTSRDWSAWIDTIETIIISSDNLISILSGLICLNWYDWNNVLRYKSDRSSYRSGLICLNWYDWNNFGNDHSYHDCNVGIDLPELIRLKLFKNKPLLPIR